ncbi:hypothetical protein OG203_02315 [Nocardia sp. NBC_01499]
MGIFCKNTDKPDEQPANSTDQKTADANKKRKRRRRLLGGYYGGTSGS